MSHASFEIPQTLQELLPKWAHFCLFTEKFITHELGVPLKGKHLVVGFSGGVDSTALLLVLHYLSQRNEFTITAAHLNHGLRPESEDDMIWAQRVCAALGIGFESNHEDVQALADTNGLGLEEAGRKARYSFFKDIINRNSADHIVVGHHLDDLCEDVLMRFIRGTGWPGLSGMPGYDADRKLLRPFLMLPKSTLKAFVETIGTGWREDATNQEGDATRNRIRNDLLPLILRENPNFREAVGRLWKIGRVEGDYWAEMTIPPLEALSNDELKTQHKAVRLRKYKTCLDNLGPGQALAHHLFKLDELWSEKRTGAVVQFPGDKTATIAASGVVFGFKD